MVSDPLRLFHVSDIPDIGRFEPRPVRANHPLGLARPVVWAVAEARLYNYLLPRDCPRVSYYATHETTAEDRIRFLGTTSATAVLAIESSWWPAVQTTTLWLYELPAAEFRQVDVIAGYWVAESAVRPLGCHQVADLPAEIGARNVALRLMEDIRPLCTAVAASTLGFSCIRMGKAGMA